MDTVIFACVHNAGRSQMAAAWFNALADPSKARALSAGTQPGDRVHPVVVEVMREAGIDVSANRPQPLTAELATSAALLVTMGCGDECPYVPGLTIDDWPLADPKGRPIEEVRATRDEIRSRVAKLLRSHNWGGLPKEEFIKSSGAADPAAITLSAGATRGKPMRRSTEKTRPGEKARLKKLLESRRRQLTAEMQGMMRDVRDAGRTDLRTADQQDVAEADTRSDIDLALIQMKAETVTRIDAALRRVENGTYGGCVECGERIAFERLSALPFALRCTSCEESRERVARERRGRPSGAWADSAPGFSD